MKTKFTSFLKGASGVAGTVIAGLALVNGSIDLSNGIDGGEWWVIIGGILTSAGVVAIPNFPYHRDALKDPTSTP